MNHVVCTLLEGDYHFGLAALTNSLYRNGFRGTIYAGYRGSLSNWCVKAEENKTLGWEGGSTLKINDFLEINFLPITTQRHLAHIKPNFIIQIWNGPAKNSASITYFDPDIVIKCNWIFFEKWMLHGVAIVHEIIMNDMPSTHPIRIEWQNVICKTGRKTERKLTSYLNAGFVGVLKENIDFLHIWDEMIDIAINVYNQDPSQFASYDRTSIFWSIDQDSFNITAMCCTVPISEIGPEGMDFINGGQIMSHATGSPKPWKKKYILSALKGNPPSLADKAYWNNTEGVIKIYNSPHKRIKKILILLSSFIGRFYRKY